MSTAKQKATPRTYGGLSADERVAARRLRLLDAALELYGTHGYAGTGVKDVCRAAGLTDRYFYESFRNSEELFTAAFDRATEQLLQLVAEAVAGAEPTPEAQTRAAIGAFVNALAGDPRTARLIFVERAAAGPEAERHMRGTLRRFAALVVETYRPHLRDDPPERELQMAGLALVGAIERVMIEWQEGELDASLDQVVDYLVEFFLAAGASFGMSQS
ncbi:MAG TPA: TetR/AcrR family transcriptional regulator [Solirubrobacterales bacterium]|nr:TetR/AcrR family transcriptional regulator [Solirubrobacterales bacterium]